jgi:hypothetical protein
MPAAGTYVGIPLTDLQEIPRNYSAMIKTRWMEIKTDTKKMDPVTESPSGPVLSAGTQLYFSSKIEVGGKTYLRTRHDTSLNLSDAILIDNISELTLNYIPMLNPRNLSTKVSLRKIDPATEKEIDSSIKAGTSISFSEKIEIGGITFLRTTHDTGLGVNKVIPLSKLY